MDMGRDVLNADDAVLRANRYDDSAKSSHPRVGFDTLIKIENARLLPILALLLANPLPVDISVTEPLLLRYFPLKLDYFTVDQLTAVQLRLALAVRTELVEMTVAALSADYYWTAR